MFLQDIKWPDVKTLDRANVLLVCCISALEQHGLHLPIGTDYQIGSALIQRLERRMPDKLLCLPSIWLGCSAHHMKFPGTVTASMHTMSSILRDIATSTRAHGFRRLLFLNSHGGNRAILSCSVQELGHEFPDLLVVGATYWDLAKNELQKIRETNAGGMGHACELETSIMLAISGHRVDMSKAQSDGIMASSRFSREDMLCAPSIALFKPMDIMSHHGGYGDPRTATVAKGELFLDAIVNSIAELCRDLLQDRT